MRNSRLMLSVVCQATIIAATLIAATISRAAADAPVDQAPFNIAVEPMGGTSSEEFHNLAPLDEELFLGSYETTPVGYGRDERWIDRVTDPTAWIMDLRLRQKWNWPVTSSEPDNQSIQFRPTIPFKAWDQVNLLRVTVPYNLRGADGAGLDEVEILDLVVIDESWGRWGVGPSVRMLPNSADDEDSFLIGPAAGAVTKNEHWTAGILMQNFLGSDSSQSRLQLILAYKFNERWAVGIGESEFRYDWNDAKWSQLPLGIEIDNIAELGGQKLQFFINPQYNFQRDASNSGWTLFLGVTLLVPDA